MKARQLLVLMNGRRCGEVEQSDNRLTFTYNAAWQSDPLAVPLSLSMPLERRTHEHEVISAYMWGLLPDNEITLSTWGKSHHVSANNCFALLGAVGEDCPGAVQFMAPDRIDEMRLVGDIDWLDDRAFEELIKTVASGSGRARPSSTSGQFSLAGAQAKTALFREGLRWGIPRGRRPTTHILKPLADQRDGMPENEHFCLMLASRLGFSVVETEVLRISGMPVICSRRYDRVLNGDGRIVRLHQEDTCQALAVHPRAKYENEGGPGAVKIMELLERVSSKPGDDRDRFMRSLALNYVIAGTDAHAKNYSLLLVPGGQVRLAPLYDVASFLPYLSKEKGVKLAMKIDDRYDMDRILPRHWENLAAACGFDGDRVIGYVRDILARAPGLALGVLKDCRDAGLDSPVLDTLIDVLWTRVRALAKTYGASAMT